MIRESLCHLFHSSSYSVLSLSAVVCMYVCPSPVCFLVPSVNIPFWSWSESCQLSPDFIAFILSIHMPSYSFIFLFFVVFVSWCVYDLFLSFFFISLFFLFIDDQEAVIQVFPLLAFILHSYSLFLFVHYPLNFFLFIVIFVSCCIMPSVFPLPF